MSPNLFEPDTLISLAEGLLEEGIAEPKIRTVMNRCYWACFLTVRKKYGKIRSDQWLKHKKAWQKVNGRNKYLGSILDTLYGFRKVSDYSLKEKEETKLRSGAKMKVRINEERAEEAIKLAKQFLSDLV